MSGHACTWPLSCALTPSLKDGIPEHHWLLQVILLNPLESISKQPILARTDKYTVITHHLVFRWLYLVNNHTHLCLNILLFLDLFYYLEHQKVIVHNVEAGLAVLVADVDV